MLAAILALAQLAPLTVDLSPSLACPAPPLPESMLELPAGCPAPFGGVLWPDAEHDDTRAACARAAAAARSRGAELAETRAALGLARSQRDDVTRRCELALAEVAGRLAATPEPVQAPAPRIWPWVALGGGLTAAGALVPLALDRGAVESVGGAAAGLAVGVGVALLVEVLR